MYRLKYVGEMNNSFLVKPDIESYQLTVLGLQNPDIELVLLYQGPTHSVIPKHYLSKLGAVQDHDCLCTKDIKEPT